jgi:hypothetical protein
MGKTQHWLLGVALFLLCATIVQVSIAAWRDDDPAGRFLALTELLLSWKVLSGVAIAVVGPDVAKALRDITRRQGKLDG